jgi:hypothetical protein
MADTLNFPHKKGAETGISTPLGSTVALYETALTILGEFPGADLHYVTACCLSGSEAEEIYFPSGILPASVIASHAFVSAASFRTVAIFTTFKHAGSFVSGFHGAPPFPPKGPQALLRFAFRPILNHLTERMAGIQICS